MFKYSPLVIFLIVAGFPGLSFSQQKRQIPIIVKASPHSDTLQVDSPLLFKITIFNGLPDEIRFETFALEPNSWNGETVNIGPVDIYTDSLGPQGLFLSRPKPADPPRFIAGMSSNRIKPGESLSIIIDIRKWQVRGNWKPGIYKMTVRADNVVVDAYTKVSVMSDPIEFKIAN